MTRAVRSLAALAVLSISAACAATPPPEPPAPAPLDPVGTYDFTTSADGQTIGGVVRITRGADGVYGGMVSVPQIGEMPIRTVTVAGNRITMTIASPDGNATMNFEMDGSNFTGDWHFMGTSGALTGSRRS